MKIGKQARRDAKHLFLTCRSNGVVDDAKVRQAVSAVIAQKPRGFAAILNHFQRLLKLDIDKRSVRVESAVAAAEPLKQSITANLAKRYGPGLEVAFGVDPSLIGGVRIKVGSDVFDGSVKARLTALEETF